MSEFHNYNVDRVVIDDIKLYPACFTCGGRKNRLYIRIPEKVRNEMRITKYNICKFKIIILRKDILKVK